MRRQIPSLCGSGVIWNGIPYQTPVIPAKAGIQSVDSAFLKVCGVDSRFRGNDCGLQRPCLAKDTSAQNCYNSTSIHLPATPPALCVQDLTITMGYSFAIIGRAHGQDCTEMATRS